MLPKRVSESTFRGVRNGVNMRFWVAVGDTNLPNVPSSPPGRSRFSPPFGLSWFPKKNPIAAESSAVAM